MLEISGVGIFTAFAAGLISFLSPCVLPLVPGYVSYIAGSTAAQQDRSVSPGAAKILVLGICFVLGFSTIFVALGASAARDSAASFWLTALRPTSLGEPSSSFSVF